MNTIDVFTLMHRVLKFLPHAIIVVDEEGNVCYKNEKIYHYFPSLITIKNLNNQPTVAKLFSAYDGLRGKADIVTRFETINTHNASDWKDVQINGVTMVTEGESFAVIMVVDISEQTEAERKTLLTLSRMAKVGLKTSQIIHDLKNPIGAIISLAGMIQADIECLSIKHKNRIGIINTSARSALQLLDELNAFSTGRKIPLCFETIELREWLSRLAENSGIIDMVQFVPGEKCYLEFDTVKIHNALWNLIVNACQALEGNPDGRVRLAYENHVNSVTITVSDNGPGIPEELHDSLFEPGKTMGKKNGRGLGLSSVMDILKMHCGDISWESSTDGTTFFLKLPIKHTQEEEVTYEWDRSVISI
ncbi:MAG: HAMP domain-containing histidine kinase [Reichenbachiella sp.]